MKPASATLALLLAGLSLPARAQGPEPRSRLAVVAVGQCEAAVPHAQKLRAALSAQMQDGVVSQAEMAAALGSSARGSLQGAATLIRNSAYNDFKNAEYDLAEKELSGALETLQALPPSHERYEVLEEGAMLQALIAKQRGHAGEAMQVLERLVRVNPGFDPNAPRLSRFPRSVRNLVKEAKAAVARGPQGQLAISTRPAGLTVYLNGFDSGPAPLSLSLPQGNYRVEVAWPGGRKGLVHPVALKEAGSVELEEDFDGALELAPEPCLSRSPAAPKAALAPLAVRLGGLLQARDVVAVYLDGDEQQGRYLNFSRFDVGRGEAEVEARIQLVGGRLPEGSIERMASGFVTGTYAPPIEVKKGTVAGEKEKEKKPDLVSTGPAPAGGLTQTTRSGPGGLRIAAYTLGGAAVLAGLSAGYFAYDARSAGQELESYLGPDGVTYRAGQEPAIERAQGRLDRDNGLAVGLGVGAGVALAAGVVLYLLSPDGPSPAQVRPEAGGVAFPIP